LRRRRLRARGWVSGPTPAQREKCSGTIEEQANREEGNEAMSLWRRIVVLVVMAAVMAFMSAPAAWAGGYDDHDKDKGNKDDDKDRCKKDDDYDNDGKQNNRDEDDDNDGKKDHKDDDGDDNDGIKDDDDKKHYS